MTGPETSTEHVRQLLAQEKNISPALRAAIELILVFVEHILAKSTKKNSRNSSMPPSQDPNRPKEQKPPSDKKPGGQVGHVFKTLNPVEKPDCIVELPILPEALQEGSWVEHGYVARQVVDFKIKRTITEYRARSMRRADGLVVTADFPKGITRPIQYGPALKAHAVYLSTFQLIPYERLQSYFADQLDIPISPGSLCNFNKQAAAKLKGFEALARAALIAAPCLNADETGINIAGQGNWLHSASNHRWALIHPHNSRGKDAMDEGGILSAYQGVVMHDHWSAYYRYDHCRHAMCGAHLLRDLAFVQEAFNISWAKEMTDFLVQTKNKVADLPAQRLDEKAFAICQTRYREILTKGAAESPPPEKPAEKKRGRVAKSKHRNLWERFWNYETEILRFAQDPNVPFTNNQAERDIRMTKVHQKISGCFKNMKSAQDYCLVRSYLLTCQKQGIDPATAMNALFTENNNHLKMLSG